MNRNKLGQFAKRSIQGIAFVIIFVGACALVGYGSIKYSSATQTYVATTTSTSDLEMLIEKKTDERMRDPKFLADTRYRARMDVMGAINTVTQKELADYVKSLNQEISSYK